MVSSLRKKLYVQAVERGLERNLGTEEVGKKS